MSGSSPSPSSSSIAHRRLTRTRDNRRCFHRRFLIVPLIHARRGTVSPTIFFCRGVSFERRHLRPFRAISSVPSRAVPICAELPSHKALRRL
ncbi:hypothetical protein BURMUCGD1_0276 [Burkholderia multivorans CGD1]|nr:hypothetical protein BURMUCGD1_0276 [Burkholderia multivorans CGD1]